MEDNTPIEQKTVPQSKNHDPNFKVKLEASYQQCLKELREPSEKWQDEIMETKFIMDPETGHPKNTHVFELRHNDNIIIDESVVKHSYVFKRNHFYSSFNNKNGRLKRDLINFWREMGYFVKLYQEDETSKKWFLSLSWRN